MRQGERIRAARKAKGLSTRALGAMVGISHVFVGKIENGERPLPGARREAFAKALDLPGLVAEGARAASDIAADLWRLRDEADALAHRVAAKAVEEQPEGVRTALEEATSALYLKDMSLESLAYRVLRALSPELLRVHEERGPKAAFHVARGETPEDL
jgi:transcriptional regulator with XRE-family HTH domain